MAENVSNREVVAIRTVGMVTKSGRMIEGIVTGRIYYVHNIMRCECGNIGYNVGIFHPFKTGKLRCGKCNRKFINSFWLFNSENFIPLQWDDVRNEIIQEAFVETAETARIQSGATFEGNG